MKSVGQAISSRQATLYEKLATNGEVANSVMALIGRLVIECANRGKQVAGISTSSIIAANGEFKFNIIYHSINSPTLGLWQPQNDIKNYVASKSAHLAKVLDANPRLIKTIEDLIDQIDRFCDHKGVAFKDFKVDKLFITKEDTFVLKSKSHLDRWGR